MNSPLYCKNLIASGLLIASASLPAYADNGFNTTHPTHDSTIISDDSNSFGGPSRGTTHQNSAEYWAEKTLNVPAAELEADREVRLRIYMFALDYSYVTSGGKTKNGLDEPVEFLINGKSHIIRTDTPGMPASAAHDGPLTYDWYDFVIPKEDLKAGLNTFLFRKMPSEKNDDYFYLGIDNSVHKGHSRSSLDAGKTWRTKELNVPGATGEYMVRLVFTPRNRQTATSWTPGSTNDAAKIIGYQEVHGSTSRAGNSNSEVELSGDGTVELQLNPAPFDRQQPIRAVVNYSGEVAPRIRWSDTSQKPIETTPTIENGKVMVLLPVLPIKTRPGKLEVLAPETGAARVNSIRIEYTPIVTDLANTFVDMAPLVSAPKGGLAKRASNVVFSKGGFLVQNGALRASFKSDSGLRLVSLYNEYLRKNMLARPAETRLFLLNVNDKVYGAEDFKVASVKPLAGGRKGVAVRLLLPQEQMAATLTIAVDNASTLRLGLALSNTGKAAKKYKTAFPHLAGVQLSGDEKDDFYLFPLGGGIVASVPTSLRTTYGEQTAWWQMMDIFSPSGGAGISMRADDPKGIYKSPALRKGTSAAEGAVRTDAGFNMGIDAIWGNSLEPTAGTSLSFEYQLASLAPGQSAAVPDGVLDAHPGDWHIAMRRYADWAHKTWKWRAFPSKLKDVWNVHAPGWGKLTLFKDGKYDTSYINDQHDSIEPMSYWEWSTVGPWRVPMDRIKEELGERLAKDMDFYFVKDPATGVLKFPLNVGDYTGTYNKSWGGLPALRAHIKRIQNAGKPVVLYTNPIVASDATEFGHKYGPQYGVMNQNWKPPYPSKYQPEGYITTTVAWNMDPNTRWFQSAFPKKIVQLLKETGADGVRLDEYGHGGYVCYSNKHQHILGQPGQNVWLQAVCDTTDKIRAAMDQVDPNLILSTEYPGIDRLSANLQQAISYECAFNLVPGVRPVPCTIYRFYFPEVKLFDLDNQATPNALDFRFFNVLGGHSPEEYGLYPQKYHVVMKENSDVFVDRQAKALLPTLAPRIYANRFTGGGKSITMLINGREFTANEPILSAPTITGSHYFDLLNGRELRPTMINGKPIIGMKLRSQEAACVAALPQRLQVQANANGWNVSLRNMGKASTANMTATLCTAEGEVLARVTLTAGRATFESTVKDADKAVCIKLLQGKYLVDAAELPTVG